ncbi:hypothetical protein CXG81DRAFT_27787 [Caulochytrium protostelioides]|uniref:Uncharacterized protein n=1 Tax=Caulochytrium protostelioides TaxID=1555241 RepID=A0A4P9X352_9FUNG|nr:hypothetical protein CXG81DRAFT_27787 [Caulochytrium protostelioides]|eukprot:RKO99442.1 hypothetical protein CXG81DRAFT_27787 [Caulochytrium protostelioides]
MATTESVPAGDTSATAIMDPSARRVRALEHDLRTCHAQYETTLRGLWAEIRRLQDRAALTVRQLTNEASRASLWEQRYHALAAMVPAATVPPSAAPLAAETVRAAPAAEDGTLAETTGALRGFVALATPPPPPAVVARPALRPAVRSAAAPAAGRSCPPRPLPPPTRGLGPSPCHRPATAPEPLAKWVLPPIPPATIAALAPDGVADHERADVPVPAEPVAGGRPTPPSARPSQAAPRRRRPPRRAEGGESARPCAEARAAAIPMPGGASAGGASSRSRPSTQSAVPPASRAPLPWPASWPSS